MQINVQKNAVLLLVFIFGLVILWLGMTGRFGLFLGAIFTPEYLVTGGSENG